MEVNGFEVVLMMGVLGFFGWLQHEVNNQPLPVPVVVNERYMDLY